MHGENDRHGRMDGWINADGFSPQTIAGHWPPWWTPSCLTPLSRPPHAQACVWLVVRHWSSGCQTCLSEWEPGQMSETALERKCPWNMYQESGPLVWCWAVVLGHCWSGPVHTAWPPSGGFLSLSLFLHTGPLRDPWNGLGKGHPRWCLQGFWWNVGASGGEPMNTGLATTTESTRGVAMW